MDKVTLVVLNAGEGSRLRPLTTGVSKAMIRVNGKPVIDHIVQSVGADRISRLVVVQGRLNDAERHLMRKSYPFSCEFVWQDKPTGPKDAVKLAATAISSGPVVVWFGDTLVFSKLPLGDTFFATHDVSDHSEWLMWDGHVFHDKPNAHVKDGRAFVGVFGASSVNLLHQACNMTGDYDVGGLLRMLMNLSGCREARNVEWHDIGVPARYYATCAKLLNRRARAFNNFEYDPHLGVLSKMPVYGSQYAEALATIEAEAIWYQSLTREQSMIAPRFVSWQDEGNELRLGYEPGILLSDLALYHDLPASFWDYVLGRVVGLARTYLHNGRATTHNFDRDFESHTAEMWSGNVVRRLAKTDLPTDVCEFVINACKRIEVESRSVGTMHGDMHLSNILYEPTTGRIVFLDPRGRYGSYVGPHGSDMYDFCKLAYDCYHGFSAIVAGVPNNPHLARALDRVLAWEGIACGLVRDGAIALLASGIPLHYDDSRRQNEMRETVIRYVKGRT